MKNFTAQEMIATLAKHSKNDLCKNLCQSIIDGHTTIEKELPNMHGSFITAVLSGSYARAWLYGDIPNRAALLKLSEGSEEWNIPEAS